MSATETHAPKHRRVCDELRRRILTGEYPAGSKLPTEVELPGILNAAKQTVVRALNDLVQEGLIVRKRGSGSFVSPSRLRSLLKGRHLHVGVLWHKSVNPVRLRDWFQGDIVHGLLEGLEVSGAEDLETRWPQTRGEAPTRGEWISRSRGVSVVCLGEPAHAFLRHPPLDAVRGGQFDVLVVLSILEPAFLRSLEALGVPLILVDVHDQALSGDLAQADRVFIDAGTGYRAAVAHFAAQGLRRLHFVAERITESVEPDEAGGSHLPKMRTDPESFARYTAFLQGLEACGLPIFPEHAHFSHERPEVLARRLAALPEAQRPQALVCHSYLKACRLVDLMGEAGIAVQAAGTSHRVEANGAHAIVADGKAMGIAAAELLCSRLQRPERTALRAGVPACLDVRTAAAHAVG